MGKNVTIRDIARETGVSVCCVSWVLNGHPRSRAVSGPTRRRVLDCAAKMGYSRNQLAIATRTGKVNTIAVILDFNQLPYTAHFNRIIAGVMMEASVMKYSIKIFPDSELENSFRTILENRIDKVISMSVHHPYRERSAELAEKYAIDLVFAYERGHDKYPAVNVDNVEMTAQLVHYLAGHGHTRIALLCVPHRWHYVEDRHEGYLRGMAECGLQIDPDWISCSDETEPAVEKMLALPSGRRPTAYVALADIIAAEAQRYAVKRGLRIPEDFSIAGIGNAECSCFTLYPLTTLEESLSETGKLLVRLLMKEPIEVQPDQFNVYHTHAKLIERDSVYHIQHNRKEDCK